MKQWIKTEPTFEFDERHPEIREQSAWKGHFNFAYDLIRYLEPERIVELGTYMGGSFFSMAQALKDGEIPGVIHGVDTWSGDPHSGFYGEQLYELVANVSESCYPNVTNMVRSTFDEAVDEFDDGSIDVLHIDGYHTYEAVSHDYQTWLPKLKEFGVVLFHDTNERKEDFGVWEFWEEIRGQYPHLEFLHSHGLGVLFPKGIDTKIKTFTEHKDVFQLVYNPEYTDQVVQQELIFLLRRLENNIDPAENASKIWTLVELSNLTMAQLKELIEYHTYDTAQVRKHLLPSPVPQFEPTTTYNKTSIIILTYNNLKYNQGVVESIRKYTQAGTYEIIIVDNASTDGTRTWLEEQSDLKLILNDENVGFPKGCNMGINIADPENDILLLNNDIEVTERWLENLQTALHSDDKIGAVQGLDSAFFAGQQDALGFSVDLKDEETVFAHHFARQNNISDPERWHYTNCLIGYCFLVKRRVVDQIGLLDEQFSPGNYEDDDWSFRILQSGHYLLRCYDCYIHHFGSKSFRQDEDDEKTYSELLTVNRHKFYRKWGFDAWDKFANQNQLASFITAEKDAPIHVLQLESKMGHTLFEIKNRYKNAVLYGVEEKWFYNNAMDGIIQVETADPSMAAFNFEAGQFDYILAGDIITKHDNPATFLADIKKYLKPGGHLILKFENILNIKNLLPLLLGTWQSNPDNPFKKSRSLLTGPDFVKLSEETGYVNLTAHHFYHEPTEPENDLIKAICQVIGDGKVIDYKTTSFIFRLQNGYTSRPLTNVKTCSDNERELVNQHLADITNQPNFHFNKTTEIMGITVQYSNYFAPDTMSWARPQFHDIIKTMHITGEIESHELITLIDQEQNIYAYKVAQHFWDYSLIYQLQDSRIDVLYWREFYVDRDDVAHSHLEEINNLYPNVMTTTQTIDYIIENKCSLTRFGDGEYSLAQGHSIGFQTACPKLQSRLLEILSTPSDENLLVAMTEFASSVDDVPNAFGELSVWEYYWYKHFETLSPYFTKTTYGNATVSRQSVFFENELSVIKKLWDNRDVVIVTGAGGRFELTPELFDNINSHQTIEVAHANAFSDYDQILNKCLTENKDKLFLLSCGPTATVLAYDLTKVGYQALDIGHLPNAYQQYLGLIVSPESLPIEKEAVSVEE